MRKFYDPSSYKAVRRALKRMSLEQNVTLNVIELSTGQIVQSHVGHNAATNSMLTGIAHYLIGDGVYNQGYTMLSDYVPRYISLGTMGLISQESDSSGLPIGLGSYEETMSTDETNRLCHYMTETPGFGADGYEVSENNNRVYMGLGPTYDARSDVDKRKFNDQACYCELTSSKFPRVQISMREIVPEYDAEAAKTIDVTFTAMISVGALAQFRGGKDYVFVTEAGLWSNKNWSDSGANGLLAGYRIMPPNQDNWYLGKYVEKQRVPEYKESHYELSDYTPTDSHGNPTYFDPKTHQPGVVTVDMMKENQKILKQNILRVGKNQVVQVIWKIQLGALEQLGSLNELYPNISDDSPLYWHFW